MEQQKMSKRDQLTLFINSTRVQPEHTKFFCEIIDVYWDYLKALDTMERLNSEISTEKATSLPQSIKTELL